MKECWLPELVGDIMTPNPISIQSHQPISDAVNLITQHRISALPVVTDEKTPIGVISQKDLLNPTSQESQGNDFYKDTDLSDDIHVATLLSTLEKNAHSTVEDHMTAMVFAIHEHNSVTDAINIMLQRRIHRLFVVDKDRVLTGVLSLFDILKALKLEQP